MFTSKNAKLPSSSMREFDRAGVLVADRLGRSYGRVTKLGAGRFFENRRRAFLDDLLVPPLDRAFALEEMNDISSRVAYDLDLDVARPPRIRLDEQGPVAERRESLAPSGFDGVRERPGVLDHPHPASAPACGSLDENGKADRTNAFGEVAGGVNASRDLESREHRHAGRGHRLFGGELRAHCLDHVRRRSHERQPCVGAGPGERGVLRQEPVSGVNGVSP